MVTQYSHDPLKGIPLKHYTSGDWQYQYMYSTSTLKRIYLTYIRHVIWKTGVKFIVLICQLCSTFWPVRSLITTSSLWKHYFVRHFNMAMFFVGFFLCFMLFNQTFLDRQLSCISGDVLLFTITLQLDANTTTTQNAK